MVYSYRVGGIASEVEVWANLQEIDNEQIRNAVV